MRLRLLLQFFPLLLLSAQIHAAQGGPDAHGYTWADSGSGVPFEWIDISSTGTAVLADPLLLAANFTLEVPWGGIYGSPVSQLRASRNGYLTNLLTDSGNDETNDCPLPTSPSVGGGFRIYPLHDKLRLDATSGRILYQYFPASPHSLHRCGVHVITWKDVYHFGSTELFSFQALLFDNLDILFQYGAGNPENGLGSTTGIQNDGATIALSIYCDEKEIGDDFAILIEPPVITVNTSDDELNTPAGAALSLREAVRDAADGARIRFSSALNKQTIDLSTLGVINVSAKALAIDASALAQTVHLSGGDTSAHFNLGGAWLSLENLYLEKGGDGSIGVGSGSSLIGCHSSWVANRRTSSGGALSLAASGTSSAFYRCDFMGNGTSANGGALAVGIGGKLRAEQCRFWRNASDGTGGGGAIFLQDCDAILRECDIASNSASKGGGLLASDGVGLSCFGCTFDDNRASIGGGAAVTGSGDPTDALFHYCTFFQNVARLDGGALAEATFLPALDLDTWHCTFYQNRAGTGGGAISLEDATCHAAAIIMADNGDDQLQISAGGTLDVTFGDNIETGNEGGFSSSGQSNIADIALTDLGHFGGFVRTCVPLQASPAIDTAFFDNAASAIDARGFPTFRDGAAPNPGSFASDVGAVEIGPTVTFNSNASFQTVINAAENGGVVAPDGIGEIALPGSGFTVPAGKTVFIDGSPAGRLQVRNLTVDLDAGQSLALYCIQATADTPVGGLALSNGGQLTVDRCSFTGYSPRNKHIIDVEAGSASVLRTSICNTLSGISSLAITSKRGALVARDTAIQGCTGLDGGAGGINAEGGVTLIQRCSITGNQFRDSANIMGAAIGVRSSLNQTRSWTACENNTISDNRIANGSGSAGAGGIVLVTNPTFVTYADLAGNTVVGNTSIPFNSAALYLHVPTDSSIVLDAARNIFAANSEDYKLAGLGTLTITAGKFNLSDTNPAFFTGSDIANTEPQLGPLVTGPYDTRVHVPQPGSPCIDIGMVQSIPPLGAADGRGLTRSIDADGNGQAQTDIGAVESGRVLIVTTSSDENDGGLGLGAGDSLRECIEEAIALGTGNIGFEAALSGSTITLGNGLSPASGILDIQGADRNITLVRPSGVFFPSNVVLLSVSRLTFEGGWAIDCFQNSRTCVSDSIIAVTSQAAHLRNNAHATIIGSVVTASDNTFAPNFDVIDTASLLIDHCAIVGNSGKTCVRAKDDARVAIKATTIAQNASRAVDVEGSAQIDLIHSTVTRNGLGFFSASANSSIRLLRCVVANNNNANFGNFAPNRYLSLGGNLFDSPLNEISAQPDDIGHHAAYLAPLADYDGDGVPEMPLLSASPAFNIGKGSAPIPTEVITVTTAADQNDTPAGAEISLREAVRDIGPGGTIVFAPALNNATLDAGTSLELPRQISIDATSLPLGIDLTTRLFTPNTGVRIALHGIHIRDVTTSGLLGGAVNIGSGGSLTASHCAFSGINATVGTIACGSGGVITLENCTLAQNTTSNTSAVFMNNGTARIAFCTFGEGRAAAEVISGGGELELYANAFFGNTLADGTTPAASIKAPAITLTSLGYNVFPDTPASASADDIVNFTSPVFMPFDNYALGTAWVGSYQTLPLVGTPQDVTPTTIGIVPPPEHDTRGVRRVFGSSADAGAHENAGELVDTDNDQLPDWWELQNGYDPSTPDDLCADDDNDGLNLGEEYRWRTDPHNPTSGQVIALSASGTYSFDTIPGYTYIVETSIDLSTWNDPITLQATGSTITVPFDMSPDRSFIRVRRP